MFFVVKINSSSADEKFVVPIQWIHNLKIGRTLNYGINKKKIYRMFYSLDHTKQPNFLLKTSKTNSGTEFCFYGKIIKGYGTKRHALHELPGTIESEIDETFQLQTTFKSEMDFLISKVFDLNSKINNSMFSKGELLAIEAVINEHEPLYIDDIFVLPHPMKSELNTEVSFRFFCIYV